MVDVSDASHEIRYALCTFTPGRSMVARTAAFVGDGAIVLKHPAPVIPGITVCIAVSVLRL
jgi:hypothetical protein